MLLTPNRSNPDIISLIKSAAGGDEEAFCTLLAKYTPLINSEVLRYFLPGMNMSSEDKADLRQEATLAFYRAVTSYDTEKSEVEFGFYAKECIKNALISLLRKIGRQIPSAESEAVDEIEDIIPDPSEIVIEEEAAKTLYIKIEKILSPLESRIWWMFVAGTSIDVIASKTGKDKKSVSNTIYRARRKLRETLGND